MIEELKTCSTCNEEKSITEFYSNGYQPNGKKKYKPKCKSCQTIHDQVLYVSKIEEALAEEGRKYECEICGYNKNTAALCFHHLDPSEKEFEITSAKTMALAKLKIEIKKCVVLCSNCHMEEHYPHLTRNSC